MIRRSALRETVELITALDSESGLTDYGDAILETVSEGDFPAAVQPSSAIENQDGRDVRVQRYIVTLDPTAPVDGLSTIIWRGRTLTVTGEPLLFTNRHGAHHWEFETKEVEGA